ncbi:MAG: BatA domain-containing protein, partial [Pseudomonadota bacterium]|nr:BatA domain-containing protein [Pseudomonadota bacterium]
MSALPLAFASPWILLALGLLPVIWWLLRLTPPRPQSELFPPLAILARLIRQEETPAQSPWWLTLLRLLMAALIIVAMAGPVWNPREAVLAGQGPVVLVIDDGWASATDWEARRRTAEALVAEAASAERTVLVITTADPDAPAPAPIDPDAARAMLQGMEAEPLAPDHAAAARRLREAVRNHAPGSVFFLSDGIAHDGAAELGAALAEAPGQREILLADGEGLFAMAGLRNDPDALTGTLIRPEGGSTNALPLDVTAHDIKGLPLAGARVVFESGETSAEFRFDEPVELRNQIVRVDVDHADNAGAVQLLDDSYRRRVVGLVTGESSDLSQPLLSPLYYISRALSPFSDIREALDANVAIAVPELIGQGVSAIVLADVGNLPEETEIALGEWVGKGGMLIRFAGPRLAAAGQDSLLPVDLRAGGRSLGGALSWDTPKKIAAFEPGSPFFGIEPPREVTVSRQVLALQEPELESRTWAVLEDGTPLVTAERRDAGWLVLFHTSSDARWSNLVISGTFVEMLRSVVNRSRSNALAGASENIALPPLRLLDGKGRLGAPGPRARPLVLREGQSPVASVENPPGFYGTEDGFAALNLFSEGDTLTALAPASFAPGVATAAYAGDQATPFRPWLLLAAALLLALDCLAVHWIAGTLLLPSLARRFARTGAILAMAAATGLVALPGKAQAQSEEGVDFSAALSTRLAYVVTGEPEIDEISRAGMLGLTRFLAV